MGSTLVLVRVATYIRMYSYLHTYVYTTYVVIKFCITQACSYIIIM